MIRSLVFACVLSGPCLAQSIVPAAPIRAGTIIDSSQLAVSGREFPNSFNDIREIVGLEARVNLYPNRPILPEHLSAPTLVHRNSRVEIIYRSGALLISVTGRALSQAGEGETLQVMNLSSRTIVLAVATGPNLVEVLQ